MGGDGGPPREAVRRRVWGRPRRESGKILRGAAEVNMVGTGHLFVLSQPYRKVPSIGVDLAEVELSRRSTQKEQPAQAALGGSRALSAAASGPLTAGDLGGSAVYM